MKTLIRSVLLAGGLAFGVGVLPANAQVYQEVTFKTTFPFMVERTMLPAGSYSVRPVFDGDGSLLKIQGQGGTALFFGENAGIPRVDPKQSVVMFDHSGDRYTLSEVWDEPNQEGAEIIPPRGAQSEKSGGHQVKK
jgi:hypothetical protein